MNQYYRGDIYYVYPRDTVGCEQASGRPAIIVSNDIGNEHSRIVEVVYLTTKDKKPLLTHVEIYSAKHPSTALCEQIETVSKERLGNYINSVTQNELKEIDRALLVSLDINCNLKGGKKLEAWEKLIEEWENDDVEEAVPEEVVQMDNQKVEEIFPHRTGGSVVVEETPEYIRACAERDVYKELYFKLLAESRRIA